MVMWPFKSKTKQPVSVICPRGCGRTFASEEVMRIHLVDYWRTAGGTKPYAIMGYIQVWNKRGSKKKWVPDTYDGPFRKVPGGVIW